MPRIKDNDPIRPASLLLTAHFITEPLARIWDEFKDHKDSYCRRMALFARARAVVRSDRIINLETLL